MIAAAPDFDLSRLPEGTPSESKGGPTPSAAAD